MDKINWTIRNKGDRYASACCPKCQSTGLKVCDSRANKRGIRRRRKCCSCGHKFNTIEIIEDVDFASYISVGEMQKKMQIINHLTAKLNEAFGFMD